MAEFLPGWARLEGMRWYHYFTPERSWVSSACGDYSWQQNALGEVEREEEGGARERRCGRCELALKERRRS